MRYMIVSDAVSIIRSKNICYNKGYIEKRYFLNSILKNRESENILYFEKIIV